MSTKNWIGTGAQSSPGSLRIVQNSTGYILDADDDTFRQTPGTEYYTPTEDPANPGSYSWSKAGLNWGSDTYRWYWYSGASGTGDVVVSAMTLVSDEEATYAEGIRTALGMSTANLDAQLSAITADTNELQGDWANGGRLDLLLDTAATGTIDAADIRSAVGLASANLDTQLDALPTAVENADALLKRDWNSVTGEAARSVLNALRFLRNKWTLTSTTLSVKKEDDATEAWAGVVTTDASADPITGSDPS